MVTHPPLSPSISPGLRNKRGFTLIELIISIVLIGLLAAAGTTMISDSFDTTYLVNSSQSSAGRARYAMERLEREIREGKTVTAKSGTGMTFIKGDGTTTVTIASGGGALTVGGATLIANEVTVNTGGIALLTYLTATGGPVTEVNHSDVRYVQIYLTVVDPTSGQTISQRTRVALRNAV